MKVIDARTGEQVYEGWKSRWDIVTENGTVYQKGWVKVLKIVPGIFSAKALYITNEMQKPAWIPLIVRYTHPGFMFQHMAFFPS